MRCKPKRNDAVYMILIMMPLVFRLMTCPPPQKTGPVIMLEIRSCGYGSNTTFSWSGSSSTNLKASATFSRGKVEVISGLIFISS